MDILAEFGSRVKELRARSGISQELLAHRSELDRTYISGVERGMRNISLVNIEKIAGALSVPMNYLFSNERFTSNPVFLKKEAEVPISERFKYHLDWDHKLLTIQIQGLVTGANVDYISKIWRGIVSNFAEGELSVFVDHRDMKAGDGVPVVFFPEVIEKAVVLQQNVIAGSKKAIVLCNSEFMVHQLNYMTSISGVRDKTTPLYDTDKQMLGQAYELLEVHGNELIKL
ncbi:helix-turn-helix transcriptional regulator [Paenibacillus sp. MMS20-IR301]|uniref:helix-turn-helix domain-containing protein n=1 Tax=Paenibacillus sp. MMS20-IR301 TaxID=2895946 RepID=UPI0028E2F150|nr:helix-turn-helix transcriptional regulator [Paenibacillus sp. MMS20-IR301]WNS41565.1 helix-turn-helix transcriptional regulator [Paenibacillus sp. MMS20-IR301]